MAIWIPTGRKMPTNINNEWERLMVHSLMVGEIVYNKEFVVEDDGVSRPLVQTYTFRAATGENRLGFRGSIELDWITVSASDLTAPLWTFAKPRFSPTIPEVFFPPV